MGRKKKQKVGREKKKNAILTFQREGKIVFFVATHPCFVFFVRPRL